MCVSLSRYTPFPLGHWLVQLCINYLSFENTYAVKWHEYYLMSHSYFSSLLVKSCKQILSILQAFLYSLEHKIPLIAFSGDRCLTLFDHPLVDSLHTVYCEPKVPDLLVYFVSHIVSLFCESFIHTKIINRRRSCLQLSNSWLVVTYR